MVVPYSLVLKNLFSSRLVAARTILTLLSLVIAIFLLCFLRSLVASLDAGVKASSSNRLQVQSAVSLFVDLPLSYQGKIEAIDGVEQTTKFQWFGGVYQDPKNFFGQFGIDHDRIQQVYPEIELTDGKWEDFLGERNACLIGSGLAKKFPEMKIGSTVPLIGTIFSRVDGTPWTFKVAGVYHSKTANVDNNTMFFHFAYLDESLRSGAAQGPRGAGVFTIRLAPGANATQVMSRVDALFENGPQRVQTTTEAEFQRQFVSMLGNIPTFIASIGGGVLFAIALAVLNTMLMAGRERTRDLAVLKALGFTDATAFLLLLLEGILLCGIGGVLGVGLAVLSEPGVVASLGGMFPGYAIDRETIGLGLGLSLGLGVVAGSIPAWRASRLHPVEALRREA